MIMQRKISLVLCAVALGAALTLMTGCNNPFGTPEPAPTANPTNSSDPNALVDPSFNPENVPDPSGAHVRTPKATKIIFERVTEDAQEYAVVTGQTDSLVDLWVYITPSYDMTELDRVNDLLLHNDHYYLVAGGDLICLELEQGSEVWKNKDFGGASAHACFDENDNIYVTGYYGPSLFIADKNGNTVKRIDSFDSEYYWPSDISYENGVVRIEFESAKNLGLEYPAIAYDVNTGTHKVSK